MRHSVHKIKGRTRTTSDFFKHRGWEDLFKLPRGWNQKAISNIAKRRERLEKLTGQYTNSSRCRIEELSSL